MLLYVFKQERTQQRFFRKPSSIPNDKSKNPEDNNDSGSDHDRPHRKHHSDSGSSASESNNSDTDIVRIKKKKEKKLRRDASLMISSPLALGLKYLTTESAARAATYEQAILLRAIRPNSTTLPQILKNDKLLNWDPLLVLNAVKRMFQHQQKHYQHHDLRAKADKLAIMASQIKDMMIEDLLIITASAMYAVMTAFWTQDPSGMLILNNYIEQRAIFTTDPNNRVRNLASLSGLCIGYNFKFEGCNVQDCPYGHYCAFHTTERLQHPSMRCSSNPNRWKAKRPNYGNQHGNGRWGKGRHNKHHHGHGHYGRNNWPHPYPFAPQYNPNQNYPQFPPNYPQFHPNLGPQNPYPINNNPNDRGNKDRFFRPPKK